MGLGGVFGPIHMNSNVDGEYDMSGIGGLFDFKIGGAIKENLILHATLLSNSLAGPKITATTGSAITSDQLAAGSFKTSNQLTIGESMFGGGVTYYTPSNLFVSGSLGLGNFTLTDQENNYSASTEHGLSFQLKAGKEWWVSRRWGLGAAITYGKTSVDSKPSNDLREIVNSNRFGILFSATLN